MKVGDYVEVSKSGYRITVVGSLGKVIGRGIDQRLEILFEFIPDTSYELPIRLDVHSEALTVIPKEIYDIKLKAYQV